MSNNEHVSNIVSCFINEKLLPLSLEPGITWKLPQKTKADKQSRIQYGDCIGNNIYERTNDSYDTAYLKKMLEEMDNILSKGVPFDYLSNDDGIAFPAAKYSRGLINYYQLYNKTSCQDFIEKICKFSSYARSGKDALKIYYLLGYVGSGKSTLLNHINLNKNEYFNSNNIVSAFFEYNEISSELYNNRMTQKDWNAVIEDIIYKKIIYKFDYVDMPNTELLDELDDFKNVKRILSKHNVILFFDGFDSLSANKIERENIQLVLNSIKKVIGDISNHYIQDHCVTFGCHVVFSLRKCTYDTLKPDQKIGRRDANNAYFLHPANFNDVIEVATSVLKRDMETFGSNMDMISEIIKDTSEIADKEYSITNSMMSDVFDSNYRRRLRYISSVIIVHALRLSNIYSPPRDFENDDIHSDFLHQLKDDITSKKKDYLLLDILVYGVNTCYNNHFSSEKEEYNLGSLCGFLDNIFCYFCHNCTDHNTILVKLRILQILNENVKNNLFQYMSVNEISDKMESIGYHLDDIQLDRALDFLEKSLFVRSHFPYDKDKIHFRCSNFGSFLLKKAVSSYSYISAVCQNTCLPFFISEKIQYRQKALSLPSSQLFIDKNWIIAIIPYILLFLRVIKSLELMRGSDSSYHIHKDMIINCRKVINNILASNYNKLTDSDIKTISDSCSTTLVFNKKQESLTNA